MARLVAIGGDDLAIATSGPFTFTTPIESGKAFDVTVATQPSAPAQSCSVTGGSATVGAANVTSVAVNCATNKYAVGGTASGLLGTALLQNNLGDDLSVSANGALAFATPIDSGAAYAVSIKSQPSVPSQTCSLTGASGRVAASI